MGTLDIIKKLQTKWKQLGVEETIESKLDIAYEVYIETAALMIALPDNDTQKQYVGQLRDHAAELMKIFFNVKTDVEAAALAERRQKMKAYNPLYLPGIEPIAGVEIEKTGRIEMDRTIYNWKHLARLALAHEHGRIMSVEETAREDDTNESVIYLDHKERAPYRIIVKDGVFYKPAGRGAELNLCDTASTCSHEKPGYAAYVINTHGEISVFEHRGREEREHIDAGARPFSHSSLNSGASVFAAGEVKIIGGKLKEITAYSGHYLPSMKNIYQTLKYFQQQGVDISQVQVRAFRAHADVPSVEILEEVNPHFYFKASDIVSWGDELGLGIEHLPRVGSVPSIDSAIKSAERVIILSLATRLYSEVDSLIRDLEQRKLGLSEVVVGTGESTAKKKIAQAQILQLSEMVDSLLVVRSRMDELRNQLLSIDPAINLSEISEEIRAFLTNQEQKAKEIEHNYFSIDLGLSNKIGSVKRKIEPLLTPPPSPEPPSSPESPPTGGRTIR